MIKVLLVEESPSDVRLILDMLAKAEGFSFDFENADQLSSGLKRLAAGGIELVLLSLSLPDSRGFDTFDKMHAQAPDVSIIVLVDVHDEDLGIKAVQEGAQDYLIRGQIDSNLLIRAIRYAIERKRTERALQGSQAQLQQAQKMKALGTLVAGVAHEINNPINLIMFNVPLLKRVWNDFQPILKKHAGKDPDRKYGGLAYDFLKEHLNLLLSDMDMAVTRVAKIVTDLTDFARQSSVTDKSPMQINTAVENAIRLARTTLGKSGVDLRFELGNNLPLIQGNLQSIEQIILNLIINAVQAIDHDQGEVKVVTGFQKKDGFVFLSISDNGRGIDPSISDKLFDPFVTDKQAEGGTGLGLSITYNLVKAHDGEITFQGRKGKGTTFTVSLPTTLRERRVKILVVDDDKTIREMLSKALTMDQLYLVDEASNGVEACIKLGTYRPNLVILDIFMPDMDGVEVCRTIKKEPELSGTKVIITTGFPGHPKLKEVAELGFTNIYSKPLRLRDLLKTVGEYVQG
jgi:signal transduction histidine kinase